MLSNNLFLSVCTSGDSTSIISCPECFKSCIMFSSNYLEYRSRDALACIVSIATSKSFFFSFIDSEGLDILLKKLYLIAGIIVAAVIWSCIIGLRAFMREEFMLLFYGGNFLYCMSYRRVN